jgi:hypothetical protein
MSWDVAFDEPIELPNGKKANQPATGGAVCDGPSEG